MNDIDVGRMAIYMACMEARPPITQALDRWGWHGKSQKAHMITWLLNQPTSSKTAKAFSYERTVGNTSTRAMYNRFMNPGGLLWMAEVFGVDKAKLKEAVDAAIEAGKIDYRKRCVAFRKVIPFNAIMEHLLQPGAWMYDGHVLPYLWFDDSGFPNVDPSNKVGFLSVSKFRTSAINGGRYNYAIRVFDDYVRKKP